VCTLSVEGGAHCRFRCGNPNPNPNLANPNPNPNLALGAATQSQMLDRTLCGLAFFFTVDEEVASVATLYDAAFSRGLGLHERLMREGPLASPAALADFLRGRSALQKGTALCILGALEPDKMFRLLPPSNFECQGFWRLSAPPAILSLPVPAGRKAHIRQGAPPGGSCADADRPTHNQPSPN
jgi:hypothetical protein